MKKKLTASLFAIKLIPLLKRKIAMKNMFFTLILASSTLFSFVDHSVQASVQTSALTEMSEDALLSVRSKRGCNRRNHNNNGLSGPQYGTFFTASGATLFPAPANELIGNFPTAIPFSIAGPTTNGIELISNLGESAIQISVPGDYQVTFGAGTSSPGPNYISLSLNGIFPVAGTLFAIGDFTSTSTIITITPNDVPAILKVVNSNNARASTFGKFFVLNDLGAVTGFITLQLLSNGS